jgi:hypothetical protein
MSRGAARAATRQPRAPPHDAVCPEHARLQRRRRRAAAAAAAPSTPAAPAAVGRRAEHARK